MAEVVALVRGPKQYLVLFGYPAISILLLAMVSKNGRPEPSEEQVSDTMFCHWVAEVAALVCGRKGDTLVLLGYPVISIMVLDVVSRNGRPEPSKEQVSDTRFCHWVADLC